MSSFAKHPNRAWFAAGATTAIGLAGCSAPAFEGMQPFDPQAVYGAPSGPDVPYHNSDHEDERLQCIVFGGGAKTAATISPSAPDASSIKHVIVVMLENRSFDHLLSDLPALGMIELQSQVPPDVTNPDGRTGTSIGRTVAPDYCISNTRREWGDAHLQLNAGRMNGFVAASGVQAMQYYTHSDLPVLYGLAKTFAMSDRHFSPVLGPALPNRLFMLAATSCGFAEGFESNPEVTLQCGLVAPNIVNAIHSVNHTVEFYDDSGAASLAFALGISPMPRRISQFASDVAAGSLPDVSIVSASTGQLLAPAANGDHPAANVLVGEAFLYDVFVALTSNPSVWAQSVLFITFDEHGGFYDHVKPPRACDPAGPAVPVRDYRFDQYGFRVPLIVVSPFARRGFVSHADTDHTSITRFIEHWLGLGALTARDANAWPLLDMFDFQHPFTYVPTLPKPSADPPCNRTH
jgi:phospholipase C